MINEVGYDLADGKYFTIEFGESGYEDFVVFQHGEDTVSPTSTVNEMSTPDLPSQNTIKQVTRAKLIRIWRKTGVFIALRQGILLLTSCLFH